MGQSEHQAACMQAWSLRVARVWRLQQHLQANLAVSHLKQSRARKISPQSQWRRGDRGSCTPQHVWSRPDST